MTIIIYISIVEVRSTSMYYPFFYELVWC